MSIETCFQTESSAIDKSYLIALTFATSLPDQAFGSQFDRRKIFNEAIFPPKKSYSIYPLNNASYDPAFLLEIDNSSLPINYGPTQIIDRVDLESILLEHMVDHNVYVMPSPIRTYKKKIRITSRKTGNQIIIDPEIDF